MRLICAMTMLLTSAGPLLAAGPESARTDSGKPVRVGYYSVFHKDCTAGAAPLIRLTLQPTNGAVVVRDGILTTAQIAQCPRVSSPVRVVFYQPKDGFVGTDRIAYDVVNPDNGKEENHAVTITVGSAPAKT